MVLSNVGAPGLQAIGLISARFSAMASSSAALKSATRTLSNGGTPPAGPTHGDSNGLFARAGGGNPAASDRSMGFLSKMAWLFRIDTADVPGPGILTRQGADSNVARQISRSRSRVSW